MSTLAEDYLATMNGGDWNYRYRLGMGERIGQAFFNSLPLEDQAKLDGTVYDPFYSNDQTDVYTAIEFLLS